MLRLNLLRNGGKPVQSRASAAQLRMQKDLSELDLPETCSTIFSDPNNLFNFKIVICPDEGYYKDGRIVFSVSICPTYPHDPPKVKCESQIYHPNIDLEGNICLNILREDWKPVLSINSIVYGLQFLLLEPNAEVPLNVAAAKLLKTNPTAFQCNVTQALEGYVVDGVLFDRCVKY